MYRSISCLMALALGACIAGSEPSAADSDTQPLSSGDAASKPPVEPPTSPPKDPGKPGDSQMDDACITKVKQCYADEGDDKKCQVLEEECQPPKLEAPGTVCVTEKKKCHMDADGQEQCESITSNCSAPAPAGVKGCGEPSAPPAPPTDGCTRKSFTCSKDKDGSEVCKTSVEACAPDAPQPPS